MSATQGLRARAVTATGFPVANAVLTVTDLTGNQLARVEVDEQGTAVTEPLPSGTHTAVLTAAGHLPAARMAQIVPDGSGTLGDIALEAEPNAVELPGDGPWTIDPMHSSIVATARHLGISSIRASFRELGGRVEVASPVENSSVRAEIKSSSIDTGIAMRDDHLRSADFLDVEAHPLIEFVSTGLRKQNSDSWRLSGELTLHGQRRPIELELRYGGCEQDPWGGQRAAFHAEAQLDRSDFAISYSALVRAGVAAVSTSVHIELDIQAVRGETLPGM